jgi:RNA polymerase sigma-70 factor, ECF subfamily
VDANITTLLEEWSNGDRTALDRLAPAVYPDLHRIAAAFLRRESAGHTLQATALVNELFLKLIGRREKHFENRRHFYSLAAQLMRMALIDHARRLKADKRGGDVAVVPLHEEIAWVDADEATLLDLDRALSELEQLDAQQAHMFEMRYLLGCTVPETANLLGVSPSHVDRQIRMARAWLYVRLKPDADAPATAPSSL